MVNVGEYTIHGSYEIWKESHNPKELRTYNWTIVAILDPVLGWPSRWEAGGVYWSNSCEKSLLPCFYTPGLPEFWAKIISLGAVLGGRLGAWFLMFSCFCYWFVVWFARFFFPTPLSEFQRWNTCLAGVLHQCPFDFWVKHSLMIHQNECIVWFGIFLLVNPTIATG